MLQVLRDKQDTALVFKENIVYREERQETELFTI